MTAATHSPAAPGIAEVERIRAIVRERPMLRFQWGIVLLAVVINMLDGFDILAISFVAPVVAREWGLGPERVGFLFSSGLVGMAAGAFGLSFLTDVVGRRGATMICLVLMVIGMALSALSTSVEMLAASRLVTGAGVGAMNAATGTLVVEYASLRRRETAVGLVIFGYPFGAVAGGLLGMELLRLFDWRAIFVAGALGALVLLPLVIWQSSESYEYLLSRQPRRALQRINRILARLCIEPLAELPPRSALAGEGSGGIGDILGRETLRSLIPVCLAYFFFMNSQYFLLNWAPKLMTEAGFSDSGGISFSIAINIGGMVGGATIGLWTARYGPRLMGNIMLALLAATIALFGALSANAAGPIAVACFVAGLAMFSASTCMFSIMTGALPPHVRGTGVGLAISSGRVGSVVGAYMGGILLAAGLGRAELCIVLACPALAAALIISRVASARRSVHTKRDIVRDPA